MKIRVLSVCVLAFALIVLTSAPAQTGAQKGAETREGRVVNVVGKSLTMIDKTNKQHKYELAPTTKVDVDGRLAKATDLKPNMPVRVTSLKTAPTTAVRIQALEKNKTFAGK